MSGPLLAIGDIWRCRRHVGDTSATCGAKQEGAVEVRQRAQTTDNSERTRSGHGAGSRYYGAKLQKTIQWDTGKGGGTAREDRQRGKGRRGQKARMDGLGCIFLPESSGFLYFPFRSPFSHRNLNFRSAVTLFFGTNRSKNLRSKTNKTMVCLGYQVVQFCSFCGLKLSNWMWLLH